MTKLLLLDCDGTIREPLAEGAKFISNPHDQRAIEGAEKGIQHAAKQGYRIVGISNQGGIAMGYKSLADAIEEQKYTLELFEEMIAIYISPDYEGRQCWCVGRNPNTEHGIEVFALHEYQHTYTHLAGSFRKPGAGMLRAAMLDAGAEPADCWYIGDRPEDEAAATAAGVQFLPAEIWHSRFRRGMQIMEVSPEQLEFLEGYKIG